MNYKKEYDQMYKITKSYEVDLRNNLSEPERSNVKKINESLGNKNESAK